MNRYLFISLMMLTASAEAFERQHDSHEHGAATMMLAVDGHELQLRIESPAANFLGFEHAPRTEQELQQLKQAEAVLRDPAQVISLSTSAGCKLEKAELASSIKQHKSDEDHNHEHDEHGDDHDKNGHNHDDDHDKHGDKHEEQGHGHEDHSGSENHSDFAIDYHFDCSDIAALKQVEVQLFSQFPLLQTLELQYIAPQGQGAAELTPANPVFQF